MTDGRHQSTGGDANPSRCPKCGQKTGSEGLAKHLRYRCEANQ